MYVRRLANAQRQSRECAKLYEIQKTRIFYSGRKLLDGPADKRYLQALSKQCSGRLLD